MKQKFRDIRMGKKNLKRLDHINEIITEYQDQGYVLTLRQLYYQLVSRDIIPNKQAEYAKLSTILKEGRMAGVVDWEAIEDRLRKPSSPASFDNEKEILDAAINQFKLPRMKGQENYIEVWVEKDALSGVLSRITKRYHIPIMVNRGYSSVSAMFDAYERFQKASYYHDSLTILYLGDFDPSGLDMIRDVRDRILEFFMGDSGMSSLEEAKDVYNFKVIPIALTEAQIRDYEPPPNPAKITDPRAGDYIKRHGDTSWEVDALTPDVLNSLLEEEIMKLIDLDKYQAIVDSEEAGKVKLRNLKKYL